MNRAHLERIRAVLEVLTSADVPHAILACEDAQVALVLGLQMGLTVPQILAQHVAILQEQAQVH
jgi:hypothetical protein